MISTEEEKYILGKAYVPEHVVSLMVPISKGEPLLIDGYLCFLKDDGIIFVGYPLDGNFTISNLERVVNETIKKYQPGYLGLIAPEIPLSLTGSCQERESDYYYKLELSGLVIKKDLLRVVRKAAQDLSVEKGREISKKHIKLISEFIEGERISPRIKELYLSMPEYVKLSKTSIVLSAFDQKGGLAAFYIVELAADNFAIYVVGTYSKKNYVPHASDLLFFEMINLAKEYGKGYIHLGLGVNEGIRRFKEKWGGVPFLKYESCEFRLPKMLEAIKTLESKL